MSSAKCSDGLPVVNLPFSIRIKFPHGASSSCGCVFERRRPHIVSDSTRKVSLHDRSEGAAVQRKCQRKRRRRYQSVSHDDSPNQNRMATLRYFGTQFKIDLVRVTLSRGQRLVVRDGRYRQQKGGGSNRDIPRYEGVLLSVAGTLAACRTSPACQERARGRHPDTRKQGDPRTSTNRQPRIAHGGCRVVGIAVVDPE